MKMLKRLKDRLERHGKRSSATSPAVVLPRTSTSAPTAHDAPTLNTLPTTSNTIPTTSIPAQPSAGQNEPHSTQPLIAPPVLPVPAPCIQPSVSNTIASGATTTTTTTTTTTNDDDPDAAASGPDVNLWPRAYKAFQEREPELMEDFKTYLKKLDSEQHSSPTEEDILTPQCIESIVKKLQKDRKDKQWRIPLVEKDIKIREQCERLVKFLLWSDSLVQGALSAQPYAALAWSGVSLLLPLLISGTAQNEAMLKGFNSINDILIYWNICESTYLKHSQRKDYQSVIEPLTRLYSHIIEYQARMICHLSSAQMSRAWQKTVGWNDWAEKSDTIIRLSEQYSSYIPHLKEQEVRRARDDQLQTMHESQSVLCRLREILEEFQNQARENYEKDEHERKVLESLASDYQGYKNFNRPKVPDTCEWFFKDDRFRQWRDSNTSSLLWLSAGPGCGKSVLARALVDEDRLSPNLTTSRVCYFFFKDGDERRMHSTNALCAILHQLFAKDAHGTLIKIALAKQRILGKTLADNFSEMWQVLVECARSPDAGEIICVIDALDECRHDDRERLIAQLRDFYLGQSKEINNSGNIKLKFLVTSRPYDTLERSFQRFSTIGTYLQFDGDDKSKEIGEDINRVIDARLPELVRSFSQGDIDSISRRLKNTESRTYLWLRLTFDIIEKNPSEHSRPCDMDFLLSKLPSNVADAYEVILQRSRNKVRTRILLQMVLAAARPLGLHEANVALAWAFAERPPASHDQLMRTRWKEEEFKTMVKNTCGLFISVYDEKLYFIHQTAREFLIDSTTKGQWKGQFTMPRAHGTMSRSCLAYLLLPGFDPLIMDRSEGYDEFRNIYPFVTYASQNWTMHYRSQEPGEANQSWKDAWILCAATGPQAGIWIRLNDTLQFRISRYWTDLYMASFLGLSSVVDGILRKEKTDPNVQGKKHSTPLIGAAARSHVEIVKRLSATGAHINVQYEEGGTALQVASAHGYIEVVRLLLAGGADVNIQDEYGWTPLRAASEGGHTEVVRLLLAGGADVNIQDKYSWTPLRTASERGHTEVVRLLLAGGANVNVKDKHSWTLLGAASEGGHTEVVLLLLAGGADVNIQDEYGWTPLRVASKGGHTEVVLLLLASGADVNIQDEYGWTPLRVASEGGHTEVVRLLLASGADVNIQDKYSWTPLRAASERGHTEVVRLLLASGADVNV